MSTESPENRFRERRSAFVDPADEPAERAPEPPAPEPPVAEAAPAPLAPEPPAPEPPVAEAAPVPLAPEPEESGPPEAASPEEEPSLEEQLDLDEMARLELPDPSFNEIVYEYAIRAQQFLGETPLTREGHRHVLPNYAKHMIDLLGILEERTRGNLTPEESQLLEQVLSDLRMRYVSVSR